MRQRFYTISQLLPVTRRDVSISVQLAPFPSSISFRLTKVASQDATVTLWAKHRGFIDVTKLPAGQRQMWLVPREDNGADTGDYEVWTIHNEILRHREDYLSPRGKTKATS
jgi:hypothetical protein